MRQRCAAAFRLVDFNDLLSAYAKELSARIQIARRTTIDSVARDC
jgi:hypothetical protein